MKQVETKISYQRVILDKSLLPLGPYFSLINMFTKKECFRAPVLQVFVILYTKGQHCETFKSLMI